MHLQDIWKYNRQIIKQLVVTPNMRKKSLLRLHRFNFIRGNENLRKGTRSTYHEKFHK